MTTLYPCHLLSASTHLHVSAKLALHNKPPNSIHGFTALAQFSEVHAFGRSAKPSHLLQNSQYNISCAMNMTAGQSDDPGQIKFDHLIAKARKLWGGSPQPDAEVPWHHFVMAIFFTLLKLPGPHYPCCGQIIIPHIANGGLLRTLWFAFMWYRRPRKASTTSSPYQSKSGSQSEPNEL
ncbi:PREDICTED: uncharacterized protein LOC101312804 [Fragaria vesca subsp. vesca]|uniref:uncharacterized protein LOC101312804 n=1 Tax=Fragaria vesca subsp. vesca TaxID=101020 RepID=UPI0002C328DB|nr:PREDICTED: uncharacterized protein LOC101312804 [Fragaria vesca subsp. vesca]